MIEFRNVRDVLNDFGKLLVDEYKESLTENDVNASNKLYNSVSYIVENGESSFEVKLELEHYYKHIEEGRKPGKFPPISAIEKWIEIKPVLPRPMNNGKLPTNQQLAFLIARKIGLEGIEPKPLLHASLNDVWETMQEYIEEALAKDVQEEWEKIIGMGL